MLMDMIAFLEQLKRERDIMMKRAFNTNKAEECVSNVFER